MYRGVFVLALTLAAGCGSGGSSTPLTVVSATFDELVRDYAADPDAVRKKYENVRVELTGEVDYTRTDDMFSEGVLLRFRPPPGAAKGEPVEVLFHLSQEQKVLSLIPGKPVKVRGVLGLNGLQFTRGEVVEAAPATGIRFDDLLAETNDSDAFRKKYSNAGIKLTGRITNVHRNMAAIVSEVELKIGMDGDKERYVLCRIRATERSDQKYKLAGLARSGVVTVVGKVAAVDPSAPEIMTLEYAHVLQ